MKKYLPELLVVLLITALGFALWTQTNRLNAAKNQIKAVQLAFDQYKVEQTNMLMQEQQRLSGIIQEVGHSKDEEIKTLQDTIVTLSDNNRRLQNDRARTDAYVYARTSDNCQAAVKAYHVYADMFTEASEFAGEVAPYADRANIAGIVCERVYGSGSRNIE